ncbi:PaaI family thioesterase [Neobacillus rhizophilus]|uniref:PaaI family thioesterase n=1 Tax=Neobacillus rhizophilus TaxID=2833579 RepID=A0A942U809_9BACI|nr:PaaI family thioesterase [Neobacillus rhizophilus]MBS4214627.1 PaaI family thioesterase [Neobacillus rhizophilus]
MKNELVLREEEWMKNNRFRDLIGLQIEDIGDGTATLSLAVQDQLLQGAGMVHGGVITTLIDSVIGSAVRSVMSEQTISLTAELNINFFRPATQGRIFAGGRVINRGKLLAVGVGDVKDEAGKLLATGRATYVLKDISKK